MHLIKLKAKDDLVTSLKEAFGVDDTNEVEVVESSPDMNKETAGHKCQECDKSFRRSTDLENHVQGNHTEQTCLYCENIVNNEQELVEHHKECTDMEVANSICLDLGGTKGHVMAPRRILIAQSVV